MAKTYTITSSSMNAGRTSSLATNWTGFQTGEAAGLVTGYSSAGYSSAFYRAVNILFNSSDLNQFSSKTITSIKLRITVSSGTLGSTSYPYRVRYKYNNETTTASSGSAWASGVAAGGTYSSTNIASWSNGQSSGTTTITANSTHDFDVGTTLPAYGYVIAGVTGNAYMTLASTATLIITTNETDYTLKLSYNANGGSGAPSAQTATVTTTGTPSHTFTISNTTPTRSGYTFSGWTDGSNTYQPGGSITITANKTLTAVWTPANSVISSVSPSSVPIDGSTNVTVSITRYNNSYTHDVTFKLGTRSYTLTGQGTSVTYAIPTTWLDQLPASTSGTVTVECVTKSGSTQIGSKSTKTYTVTVPSSVKPTVTLTGTDVNDNATLDSWNVLVAGKSKILLTAAATAGTGSTIQTIAFSGDNVSQSGSQTTATSAVLTTTGSRTWAVTVTDKRGRTASATVTKTVYTYANPTITGVDAFRSDSSGTAAPSDGTYIHAKATFACSSIGGNNSVTVRRISYKAHTASSYATGVSSATDNTYYTFGAGGISTTSVYDVKYTVTDAVGTTTELIVQVQSIIGVAIGLKNDRVRFGGPVQQAGFQCDWDAEFDGAIVVTSGDLSRTGLTATTAPGGVSVATATWKSTASITLAPGKWQINVNARFASNATGIRKLVVNKTADSDTNDLGLICNDIRGAVNGDFTYCQASFILSVSSSTTIYCNNYQNSGSSMNVYGRMYAIRIC